MQNHTFYNTKHHLLPCKTIPFTTQNATFHHAKPYLLQHNANVSDLQYGTLALLRIQISLNGFHILISLHGIYCRDVPQVRPNNLQ